MTSCEFYCLSAGGSAGDRTQNRPVMSRELCRLSYGSMCPATFRRRDPRLSGVSSRRVPGVGKPWQRWTDLNCRISASKADALTAWRHRCVCRIFTGAGSGDGGASTPAVIHQRKEHESTPALPVCIYRLVPLYLFRSRLDPCGCIIKALAPGRMIQTRIIAGLSLLA